MLVRVFSSRHQDRTNLQKPLKVYARNKHFSNSNAEDQILKIVKRDLDEPRRFYYFINIQVLFDRGATRISIEVTKQGG